MATLPSLLPLEQYLRTSYKPDCDFVDGELEERNWGEFDHGRLQMEIARWFGNHRRQWQVNTVSEQRIRVARGRVRICDVCLLPLEARDPVTIVPPTLCVEILSPEDRLSRAEVVIADYRAMGVPQSWLLDPIRRRAWTFDERGLVPFTGDRLEVAGTPIYVVLSELFANLD